jgi:hypothetical protein
MVGRFGWWRLFPDFALTGISGYFGYFDFFGLLVSLQRCWLLVGDEPWIQWDSFEERELEAGSFVKSLTRSFVIRLLKGAS